MAVMIPVPHLDWTITQCLRHLSNLSEGLEQPLEMEVIMKI